MNKTDALKFINEKFNSLSLEAKNGTKTVDGYFSGKTTGHFSKHAEGEGVMLYRNSLVVMGKFPLGDGDKVEIKKDTFIRKVTYKSNTLNYDDVIEIYPNGVFCGKYTFAGDYEGIFEDNHGNKYEGKFDLENQLIMQNDKVFTDQIPFNFEQPDKIKLDFANGDKFVGTLRGGKFLSGELTYADGKSYVGNFVDGKRNGEGVIFDEVGELHRVEFKDDKVMLVLSPSKLDYEGAVYENGIKDGKGKITFKSGAEYVGELKDGKFNGKGEVTIFDSNTNVKRIWRCDDWNNGNLGKVIERFIIDGQAIYYRLENTITKNHIVIQYGMKGFISQGSFVENWKMIGYYYTGEIYISKTSQVYLKGKGKITFADGDTYEGDFVDGKREGYGVFIGKNGDKYEGYYKNDKCDGKGKEIFANGNIYEGEYVDGYRCGKFKVTYADGETYEGEFKDGLRNGYGVYVWKNGNRYEGYYKDGKQNGKGKETYVDGDTYEGEYKEGLRNGYGVYVWKNGNRYEGYFKDDKINGKGKEIFANGDTYEGDFVDEKFEGYGVYVGKNGYKYSGYFIMNKECSKEEFEQHQKIQQQNAKKTYSDMKSGKDNSLSDKNRTTILKGTGLEGQILQDARTKQILTDLANKVGKATQANNNNVQNKDDKAQKNKGDAETKKNNDNNSDKKNKSERLVYKNGSIYEGEIKNGKREGYGVYLGSTGYKYEGYFKDDKQNGKGKEVGSNGSVYEGDFVDGLKSGKGKLTFASGNIYEGEFKDGLRNGYGKMTYKNGNFYEGDFVDEKFEGQGVFTSASGYEYEGEYKANKENGIGKATYANGDRYFGEFVDGKKHGKGKYVFKDGTVLDGEWKNNQICEDDKTKKSLQK